MKSWARNQTAPEVDVRFNMNNKVNYCQMTRIEQRAYDIWRRQRNVGVVNYGFREFIQWYKDQNPRMLPVIIYKNNFEDPYSFENITMVFRKNLLPKRLEVKDFFTRAGAVGNE